MKTNETTPIPQGYKATPLGIIPQEWEVKKVKDICNVDTNSLTTKTPLTYEFEYISLSDVDSDSFEISTSHQIFQTAPSRARRIVKKGDVVISTVRPNLQGFFAIKEDVKDLIASTGFAVLSPIACDTQYLLLYFYSEAISKQFYSLVVGSNYPAVNSSDVAKIKIAVPPMAEQKKIAEVLGVWDRAIEKQSQLIEQLTLRKRGLMQQLLTAKRRLPGFSDPWKKVRLKEILIEGSKIPVDSTSRYKKISIGLYKKGISYVDDNKVKADIRPFYVREKGEIIIGKQNYFNGSIAIVNDKFDGTICSNAIMSFRVKNLFNLKFIYEAISEPDYLKKREMMANGTGQKELSEKDFLNFDIVVPSFEEQTAIAQVLTAADREIELAQQKLELLRQQKSGLMQPLLTGKKRVKY